MKRSFIFVSLLWVGLSFGVVELGEKAPEICWKSLNSKEICTRDLKDRVAVLLYSTGWCPGCQDEISELSQRYLEIKNPSVVILSLSADGFKHGAPVDEEFLKEWKAKYKIPFEVAASPNNAGKDFFEPPYYIPATVILDKQGILRFKKVDASVDEIFKEVRSILAQKPS